MLEQSKPRILAGLLGIVVVAAGCGQGQTEGTASEAAAGGPEIAAASAYRDITVDQLRAMMVDDDPFLVNVHVPFEGDIPGTDESIRFDEIGDHLDQLPQDRNASIVLYCRSGRMSAEASTALASLGYTKVSNLEGGFRAWEAAGYPIER